MSPKTTPARPGQQLTGWKNEQGKWGPYFKVAEGQSQNYRGTDDKTGNRSTRIERQHSQEMAIRLSAQLDNGELTPAELRAQIKALTDWFQSDLDTASARSSSPPQADSGATNGADSGAQLSTGDDVPF